MIILGIICVSLIVVINVCNLMNDYWRHEEAIITLRNVIFTVITVLLTVFATLCFSYKTPSENRVEKIDKPFTLQVDSNYMKEMETGKLSDNTMWWTINYLLLF